MLNKQYQLTTIDNYGKNPYASQFHFQHPNRMHYNLKPKNYFKNNK
jgi:hypothetical protein